MATRKTSTARKPAAPLTKQRSRGAAKPAPPKLRDVKADKKQTTTAPDSAPAFSHLSATDKPGVYRNAAGDFVDANGVLLSLSIMRDAAASLETEVLGKRVETPAELLKFAALNPQLPLMVRLDAAKAAAPYFDRKTPTAIETKNEDLSIDMATIAKLPREKRLELLKTLRELGVNLGNAT